MSAWRAAPGTATALAAVVIAPSDQAQTKESQVNKAFVPQFQKAVDESKGRDATEQSFEMQRQLKKQQGEGAQNALTKPWCPHQCKGRTQG
ncbi:MAG: hypothetical protein ABI240_10165 [Sphingomonas sp.]